MWRALSLTVFIFFASQAHAAIVRVGILTQPRPSSLVVIPAEGSYDVYAGGKKIYTLTGNDFLQFVVEKNLIEVKTLEKSFGTFAHVKLVGTTSANSFKVKSILPASDAFLYADNLDLSVYRGSIRSINFVDMEHYIEGVMEAEIGKASQPEFLKAKAIICRTYALSHVKRHQDQGYELCDQVHCQVYRGKPRFNLEIAPAAQATRGLVIADKNLKLITASFHSNCGGQTNNSEDVWSFSLSYLRSVKDTFCYNQPHAVWEQHIAIKDWENYLSGKNKVPVLTDTMTNGFNYAPAERETFYAYKGQNIPLKILRSDWGFKSTYFTMEADSDSLVVKGKGYGHGVGLCQEGAMKMADLGYSFDYIIKYYYKEVGIISLEGLRFLTEE